MIMSFYRRRSWHSLYFMTMNISTKWTELSKRTVAEVVAEDVQFLSPKDAAASAKKDIGNEMPPADDMDFSDLPF